MPISPWQQGATLRTASFTIQDDSKVAVNLTGATLQLIFRSRKTQEDFIGAGTWNITDAVNGKASYQWVASDVATPDNYYLIIVVTNSNGVAKSDYINFILQPV